MPALLQYELGVIGEKNIGRALAGIERRFIQHQARINRAIGASGGGSRSGGGLSKTGGGPDRAASQSEAYWRRAHQKSTDLRIRQQETAARKIVQSEAKAAAQTEAYWRRAHQKATDFRIREQARGARRAEAEAKRTMRERRKFAEGTFGKMGGSVASTLKGVGVMGGTALGLTGSFAVAGAVQNQQREAALASKLANQAGTPGIKGQLLKEARGVRGFTGEESLGAMSGFIEKTGDLDAARKALQPLADLSLAKDVDFAQMGEAAGQAFNVIRDTIKDPIKQMEALNDVMRSFAAQGSLGAVEIKDMVTELAGLGAATRRFEGGPVELLKTMGAMAQASVARGGSSSAAEATTAVSRFSDDIIKNTGNAFGVAGVERFTDKSKTKLRSPEDIMLDVLNKSQGDLEKVTDMFGVYAARAVGGFSPLFIEAEAENAKLSKGKRLKKGEAGKAAVRAEFSKFKDATVTDAQIKEAASSRLSDSDLQFKEAMKEFNSQIGTELLPVLTRLIPQFAKLIPYVEQAVRVFGRMMEEFAKDPIGGIAKIVAAKLALDMAISGVGSAAKRMSDGVADFASRFDGKGADGKGDGKGGQTLGGALGAAGLGMQLGLAVGTVIMTAGVVNFEKQEADISSTGAALNRVRELEAKSRTTALTDDEKAEVTRLRDEGESRVADLEKPGVTESVLAGVLGFLESFRMEGEEGAVDPKAAAAAVVNSTIDQNRETSIKSMDTMAAEMRALGVKIDNNTTALKTAPNRGDAPSKPVVK
jgi:hypothetical protein